MIYMDYAAASPALPEVFANTELFYKEAYANASSVHAAALASQEAIADARRKTAALIGAEPEEVYFTSGGTESDNWALFGVFRQACAGAAAGGRCFRIITTAIEHEAVLNSAQALEAYGASVEYLKPGESGRISSEQVSSALSRAFSEGYRPEEILVSVMFANNETGVLQPVQEIGMLTEKAGVLFHTDAVQAVGQVPVNVKAMHIDLLSASAHKFGGPKGAGFLYVRKGVRIAPLLYGGGQEEGLRSGTYNTAGIAGLGIAAAHKKEQLAELMEKTAALRDRLEKNLTEGLTGVTVNGTRAYRLPGHLNVSFDGVESSSLLLYLSAAGVMASGGSACAAGRDEPSHVLTAMGLSAERVNGAVRFSIGEGTTEAEVGEASGIIRDSVKMLREIRGTL